MGLFDDYETDTDAEKDGVWIDHGDYALLIRRAGGRNVAYTKAFTKALKPFRRSIANGSASEAQLHRVVAPVIARTVLVGWRGIATRAGDEIPYSVEKATELLLGMRDFFDDVRAAAEDISNFQGDSLEVAAGN